MLGFCVMMFKRREFRGAFALLLGTFCNFFLRNFRYRKACIQSALDCNGAKCLRKIC